MGHQDEFIPHFYKITKAAFFSTKKAQSDTEDTKSDVDGAFFYLLPLSRSNFVSSASSIFPLW